jgi:GPH family glycoside/pentoside/hexuronide:cation symporter
MKPASTSDKLGISELLAYGTGDLGMSLAWSMLGSFTTFYLTNAVGLPAAIAGTIILVSRIFDASSDVLVGAMVDRTSTKLGKAKPWLLRMAVPLGISFALFFSTPNISQIGKIIWVFLTYNLVSTVFYTCASVPYAALSPLMTRDPNSRVHLNIVRMLCAVLSGVIAGSITMPLIGALGGGVSAWAKVSAGYAIFMASMVILCGLLTRERYGSAGDKANPAKAPLSDSLKCLFANKFWVIMTIALVIYFAIQNASVNVYYFTYILKNENAMGLASAATAGPTLLGLALAPALSKKFSKGALARFSAAGGIAAPLILLLSPESLPLLLVKCALSGLFMAPFAAVGFAMNADVADYGYWKTGVRAEGAISSAASFGIKVGAGLGAAAVGWVLAGGGFDGTEAVPSDNAIAAIKFLMLGLPSILSFVQLCLLWFYRLDRDYPQILKGINVREGL